jgi:hypothetical protein
VTDNERFAILFPLIKEGLTARGVENTEVLQSYQPTQQGAISGRAVYLSILPSVPVGHPKRNSYFDAGDDTEKYEEVQTYIANYQVNAYSPQKPNETTSLTAMDILKAVRQTLQSSATIARLRDEKLAILRVNELRSLNFVNDKDRFEYSPSFDFALTYDEIYTIETPVIETVEHNIYRV